MKKSRIQQVIVTPLPVTDEKRAELNKALTDCGAKALENRLNTFSLTDSEKHYVIEQLKRNKALPK